MKAYIDSSVVLRLLLDQPAAMTSWRKWSRLCSSSLLHVEVHRTVDRYRLSGEINDEQRSRITAKYDELTATIEFIPLTAMILQRASLPFPTVVATLDALHLASAALARVRGRGYIASLHGRRRLVTRYSCLHTTNYDDCAADH